MISYLEGKLAANSPTHLMVDVGGVGLFVHIPLSSYEVTRELGSTVRVLTHMHVREDALALYGFFTEAERDLFEMLIAVSGIGPPMAQKIMSGVAIADFQRQILSEDIRGLTKIKGVGQKLAQRMVLELKDRISEIAPEGAEAGVEKEAMGLVEEAATALVGLGAPPLQARKLVVHVIQEFGEDLAVEEVIRQALKRM
ncbi:MAG: Holliday junction branch migration protein RuvA [bacterium]|nr:Holliday junction branch migration protein RuvA [bacterium]